MQLMSACMYACAGWKERKEEEKTRYTLPYSTVQEMRRGYHRFVCTVGMYVARRAEMGE